MLRNIMKKIKQNLKFKCNPKVFIEASKFFSLMQIILNDYLFHQTKMLHLIVIGFVFCSSNCWIVNIMCLNLMKICRPTLL